MPKQVVKVLCSLAVACRVAFGTVALVAQNGTNAHLSQKRNLFVLRLM
ncbi:hypothetical protein GA0061098_10576 [Bradyrhizobium shewense]|uniref:Uncharacterized protein n=1 Tax=Bradyrhizobium shewense TaxID=1761772 RepID=A0A1C3XUA5_9BRAD|nr:hypothetical protein [Bradyrhizobium shewense]SCB55853.1 hypothetical protein GA0061098_10576 [Bradyrhizobium shewense]